jgi:branched-subunit amino acid transport protein
MQLPITSVTDISCTIVFSLIAIWLSLRIAFLEASGNKKDVNWIKTSIGVVWIFILEALFFSVVSWVVNEMAIQLSNPSIEATVVTVTTESGRCGKSACWRYTPNLHATLPDGRELTLPLHKSLADTPLVGSRMTVVYQDGASVLHDGSAKSLATLAALLLLALCVGGILLLMFKLGSPQISGKRQSPNQRSVK